jgi:CDP-diacylglycerol--glycerol-3-phosphate 3-phosphatidyltransferase
VNLPNVITVTRILLIPVFIVLYMLQKDWSIFAASVLFALAAITDWLDGYLARRLDQTTPFGAFLDPVADKLIVVAALIILVAYHNNPWLTLPSLIIVGREIVISALREWMAEVNDSVAVAVSYLGKIKTTLQMIALTLLLSQPVGNDSSALQIGYILLYLAAVMTLWSMWQYLQAAWSSLSRGLGNRKSGSERENGG